MPVRSPQDVYATHVSSSRGYPIWSPDPSTQLLSNRPEGLRIGDVGVVVPGNGNFDVFFNLCVPKNHEMHRSIGVPEGFSHVELNDADIETVAEAENAGQVFSGSSVTRVDDSDDGMSRAGQYTFRMSSNEGAVLVLPDGAERHDVRDPRPFFEQAALHGATWYRFAEEKLGRSISHNAIYVITGFHKARSWGIAEYHNDQEDGEFTARFNTAGSAVGRGWDSSRSMECRVGPTTDGSGIPGQSVFVRGFKIALRGAGRRDLSQRSVTFQPVMRPDHASSSSGDSWLGNVWKGISKSIRPSGDGSERDRRTGPDPRIEIQRKAEIAPIFHPSDIINKYILQKEPSAKVAITHDNDWGSLLDEGLVEPEELVKDELVTRAVSQRFTIVLRNNVAYLQRSGNSDARTYTSNDVPEAVAANEPPKEPIDKLVQLKEEEAVPDRPGSLSVVSESKYRCTDPSSDECVLISDAPQCAEPADLRSIPCRLESSPPLAPLTSEKSIRTIKIIVISDYICSFCYICEKILLDAIEACRDLPLQFDVEFRPFVLANSTNLPIKDPKQVVWRNAYLVQRFGKEETELKLRAIDEFAQKTGLKLMEDNILSETVQAHRLSAKAYKDGGQTLQWKFNWYIFDTCLSRGRNPNDEGLLIEAAVSVGLMNKEEAAEFLQSTEYLDCVEKMIEAARAQGINGVPFVIIDGKWAVNGVQPMECFIQIFRKLAHLPASPSCCPAKVKTEHEGGTH